MKIELYRERLETFEQTLNRELYLHYSGFKERLELTSLFSDYSDLLSQESIREVKLELDNTSESFSDRRKSLRKIHGFLIDQHFDYRAATLTQEIARSANQQTFPWNGRTLALSQIPLLVQSERDAIRRRKLSEQYAERLSDLEGLVRDKIALLDSTARSLGFKSYIHAREYVTGVNYADLSDSVEEALKGLHDDYLERMRISAEATLGISFAETGAWDVARWRILNDPDNVFPEEGLVPFFNAMVEEMRIRPENQDAIALDLERRPGKHIRPFCIPVRVPQEIKVGIYPDKGFRPYAALLHEIAHAHHLAWTSASLPVEHRVWGDRALSESYALLFESFLTDPAWLVRMRSFEKSGYFLRFQFLYRVYMVHRCAGRLRFALRLHCGESIDNIPQLFAETMQSITGIVHHPGAWIGSALDGLEAADYLRGWILGGMLRDYVCQRYGSEWMRSRAASGFLKEIWETGHLYSADELARDIGVGALEPQILADELWRGLRH